MNPVLKAMAIYVFVLLMLRIVGKKTVGETTTFDFILLLIIAEVTEHAMVGEDTSVINCFILIATLVCMNLLLTLVKNRWKFFEDLTESVPLIIVQNGKLLERRMKYANIGKDDILEAARKKHSLGKLEEIEYAVLEKDGSISIIPQKT
ncbi:MAG: DUF421 domain-containing protein [Flavisolibacter sp.]|jgi:uncharacterized membrane protein YcaP (DUF421 family)